MLDPQSETVDLLRAIERNTRDIADLLEVGDEGWLQYCPINERETHIKQRTAMLARATSAESLA